MQGIPYQDEEMAQAFFLGKIDVGAAGKPNALQLGGIAGTVKQFSGKTLRNRPLVVVQMAASKSGVSRMASRPV